MQAHPTLKYATQEHYKYAVNSHLLLRFGNVPRHLISRESKAVLMDVRNPSKKMSLSTRINIGSPDGHLGR